MSNHTDIKRILVPIMALCLVILVSIGVYSFVGKYSKDTAAYDSVRAGVIVDKKLSISRGLFSASTVIYYIRVTGEVEDRKIEKSFAVPENVYNSYTVGDWFDSQNLITSAEPSVEAVN